MPECATMRATERGQDPAKQKNHKRAAALPAQDRRMEGFVMLKAAIIGMGDIYQNHLRAILRLPEVQLCAVCDIDPAAQQRAPEGVPFYTDWRAMVAQCQPDCVHICLPHYLHVPVSEELAERGCHVFCEKPVGLNTAQALELAEVEAAHPQLHMGICLQNRVNATTVRLKGLIDSGAHGKVMGCRGFVPWARTREYYAQKPWRGTRAQAGGGCMLNQSVHTLDLLYYLCGPINTLHASVSALLDYGIEVEDTVCARLRFACGANGLFYATNANFDNESVQITVALEKGLFRIRDYRLYAVNDGEEQLLCEDEHLPGSKQYYGAGHIKAIEDFYSAIAQNSDAYIHVRDAVMSVRLIDAILESDRQKREVAV